MKLVRTLAAGFLLIALPGVAVVRNETIQIKVLDSETRSVVLNDSGVPKNCDTVNYDAYCHNSIATLVINTLLVQVGNQVPFKVSCRDDSVWSHCKALAKGSTFDAKREKRGLSIYVLDNKGKLRQQLYSYGENKPGMTSRGTPPISAVTDSSTGDAQERLQHGVALRTPGDGARCSFTSTPSGAEINIDGHYVGSTPSTLRLTTGEHALRVSVTGFAPWTRSLTVSPDSEVTVNAVLQKLQ